MFYLAWKPSGPTSFQFLRDFKREHNLNGSLGHTGTLDPIASGLMLIATDQDTKWINYLDKGFKTYVVTLIFGSATDTYDYTGNVTKVVDGHISKRELESRLHDFIGKQWQIPPSFSAKKINGQRAYELARAGKEVSLKPSEIEIEAIKVIDFIESEQSEATLELSVSRGTYIRSFVSDLAKALGSEAYMSALVRTKLDGFSQSDCGVLQLERLLRYPKIVLGDDAIRRLKNGLVHWYNGAEIDQLYVVYDQGTNTFQGLAIGTNEGLRAKRWISHT